jgi:hypothetical protein
MLIFDPEPDRATVFAIGTGFNDGPGGIGVLLALDASLRGRYA